MVFLLLFQIQRRFIHIKKKKNYSELSSDQQRTCHFWNIDGLQRKEIIVSIACYSNVLLMKQNKIIFVKPRDSWPRVNLK